VSDQQPFTPFPFQPPNPNVDRLEFQTQPIPANDAAPPAKKKRGPKPGSKRAAKPARKGRRVGKLRVLAAPYGVQAPAASQAPDLAVNLVMSVLIGLSASEQQTIAMLVGMPDASRERILSAVAKLTAGK
jgi:hypothetical protein